MELLASFQWMKSNHDTNFFIVTFIQEHVFMGLAAGQYVAVLTEIICNTTVIL